MAWTWLIIAILLEVFGTVCLRWSEGFQRWGPATLALLLYAGSLVLLSRALNKIDAGIATAAWSGLGILLMNVIGVTIWKEPLSARKISFLALVLVGVIGLATTSAQSVPPSQATTMKPSYQPLLDRLVASPDRIFSAALLVRQPTTHVSFVGAAGEAQPGEAMTPQHTFRIASISKTFTATVVLQLVEEGKIALDDPVAAPLSNHPYVRFDQLLGDHYGPQITVRQLLTHTSGLADYILDQRFAALVMDHPQTQWSPKLIFEKYYEYALNQQVRFTPGEGYHYSVSFSIRSFWLGIR